MSNVISITGVENMEVEKAIRDMEPGEKGYTVHWAYDQETQTLSTAHTIGAKGGTRSLFVQCVAPGQYAIRFETPKYSRLGFL